MFPSKGVAGEIEGAQARYHPKFGCSALHLPLHTFSWMFAITKMGLVSSCLMNFQRIYCFEFPSFYEMMVSQLPLNSYGVFMVHGMHAADNSLDY